MHNTENNPIAYNFYKSYKKHPHNNAIFINDKYYTYSDVIELIKPIYNYLINDLKDEKRIGVFDNNDILTYCSLLAISLSNKTYIPLNPNIPSDRNNYIFEDVELKHILSSEKVNIENDRVMIIDSNNLNKKGIDINEDFSSDLIAYIIYTSGTTGKPKGVPVSNSNVYNCFNFFNDSSLFELSDNDRFLQTYDLTFDVSVFSFFYPLTIGACTYILPKKGVSSLKIAEMLETHKITFVSFVPSVLNFLKPYFNEIKLPSLRYSIFSGDTLWNNIAKEWKKCLPNGTIINFYGPTETTIICSYYAWKNEVSELDSNNGTVPIGKCFYGMDYIIDDNNELLLSGKQVIKSYINNRNPEKFISIKGKVYYKTGDLVSINNNQLIFNGRIDSQVQINGYRVELQEIEKHINDYTNGNKNKVISYKNNSGLNVLYAFVEDFNNILELNDYLKAKIPSYMIPKDIFSLKKIPLINNGKIDTRSLVEYITTHS